MIGVNACGFWASAFCLTRVLKITPYVLVPDADRLKKTLTKLVREYEGGGVTAATIREEFAMYPLHPHYHDDPESPFINLKVVCLSLYIALEILTKG
jgi:hypothetical protein